MKHRNVLMNWGRSLKHSAVLARQGRSPRCELQRKRLFGSRLIGDVNGKFDVGYVSTSNDLSANAGMFGRVNLCGSVI